MFIYLYVHGFLRIYTNKGSVPALALCVPLCVRRLFLSGSTYGTNACAGTAAKTFVGVDYILSILLGNAANGTCVSASTATKACICIDNISHCENTSIS